MKDIRVLIAAGGTGGHLYPGIALASELISRGVVVSFAVKKDDLGKDILAELKIDYDCVVAHPFPRRAPSSLATFAAVNMAGIISALRLIKRRRPSVVVGMGAYVSFPVLVAARLSGVPTLIHEQNSVPGLANKALSHIVDRVAVSFPSSDVFFKKDKTAVTGNPVREGVSSARRNLRKFDLQEGKPVVLVFGGSQGAAKINSTAIGALRPLGEFKSRIQFLHLTGEADYFRVKEAYAAAGFQAAVYPYLREMGAVYASADIAVCRAGATTIAELAATGLPAILVPYARATTDHQTKNARAHIEAGYEAEIISEDDFNPDILAKKLGEFALSPVVRGSASPRGSAASDLAAVVLSLADSVGQ